VAEWIETTHQDLMRRRHCGVGAGSGDDQLEASEVRMSWYQGVFHARALGKACAKNPANATGEFHAVNLNLVAPCLPPRS
jgi:hypothetical protein